MRDLWVNGKAMGNGEGPYLADILESTYLTHHELPMAFPKLDIDIYNFGS